MMGNWVRLKMSAGLFCLLAVLLVSIVSIAGAQVEQQGLPAQVNPIEGPWPAFPPPDFAEGIIKLDIVVRDKTGRPVTSLTKQDFTLFDNGSPQKLVSFRAVNGRSEPFDPLNPGPRVIVVLDELNLHRPQSELAESALQEWQAQNLGGQHHIMESLGGDLRLRAGGVSLPGAQTKLALLRLLLLHDGYERLRSSQLGDRLPWRVDHRKFGSESRMLPEFTPVPDH